MYHRAVQPTRMETNAERRDPGSSRGRMQGTGSRDIQREESGVAASTAPRGIQDRCLTVFQLFVDMSTWGGGLRGYLLGNGAHPFKPGISVFCRGLSPF